MVLPRRNDWQMLTRMLWVSLALHVGSIAFFSLVPWPMIMKVRPTAYTVTLVPVSLQSVVPPVRQTEPASKRKESTPVEKIKPVEKVKKDDIVEKVKNPIKKMEEPKERNESLKRLQQALEEIRKKAALDEIRKKADKTEPPKERPIVNPPGTTTARTPSRAPMVSSTAPAATPDSRMSEYYSLVWAKIKEAWTLPDTLPLENLDLETVIIILIDRDGRIQKAWFEKQSGSPLYDQMAMRAIKKAGPLPPIPRELGESSLEVGIRFIDEDE